MNFFLSHSAVKVRRGVLYCISILGYPKFLCLRRVCHDFPMRLFCLTVAKNCRGTVLCFRRFLESKSFIDKKGGSRLGCHINPSKVFCLTVPIIFVGEPFSISVIWNIEEIHA